VLVVVGNRLVLVVGNRLEQVVRTSNYKFIDFGNKIPIFITNIFIF